MKERFIVRLDFYPNGDILPLGFTDMRGHTTYVDEIVDKKIEKNTVKILCNTKIGKVYICIKNNQCEVERIE